MQVKPALLLKLSFLTGAMCLMLSCAKSDNVDYDTKVKFYNVINEASQDFYLNGVKLSTSIGYGSNSDYIVAAGDKSYNVFARNTGTTLISDSIKTTFAIGKNYSVYYYKTSAADSVLVVYEDDLTPNADMAKVQVINLGYTLGSKVNIKNRNSTVTLSIGPNEKSDYFFLPIDTNSRLSFNLADSTNVVDTISYTNFYKGKTYTILIDGVNKGASKGKLRERLISNN
ncbi:DUF4397 domain-containing protein [Pedobacter aquatilis]|uniref:DUF4397 domain-containing protein n=1 Tax=Pedobacter aquatilis TaxID=351343 RepID=UPI0029308E3C|nr:DUF4397 domain-containing protein [Pedobacter aquatilis]